MKKVKGANLLIVMIVCTLGLIIGALVYTSKAELNREIMHAKENEEDDKETFEIWTIEGALEQALEEEISSCQKQYPEVKFKVRAFKSEIYRENLLNAARTSSMPDMFYTWGDAGLKELVQLNVIRDITDNVDQKFLDGMKDDALRSYTVNNKVYGLPVFGWDTVMYCNKELFDRHYIKLPETYGELLEAVEKFKKADVVPMAIGGNEAWMGSMYYMELVLNETGVQTINSAVDNTKLLSTKAFRDAAADFRKLVILRPWQNYYGEASQQEAVDYFAEGKAAMMAGGSWMSTSLQQNTASGIKNKVAVIPFPVDAQSGRFKGVAGYSDGFALNAKSEIKDEDVVKVFLKLSKAVSDNAVEKKGAGLPVYKDQNIEDTGFEILKQCERIFPAAEYHGAYDQIFSAEITEKYNAAVKKLVKGYITDKKFIEEISR